MGKRKPSPRAATPRPKKKPLLAASREGNDVEALTKRGNTLLTLMRPEEALASYNRALALQPDYAAALSNRGLALKDLNRYEEALASYERALALRPNLAEALANRGELLMEMGEQRASIESLRTAIRANPALTAFRFKLLIAHIPTCVGTEDEMERSRTIFARELALLDEWLAANDIDNQAAAVGSAQPFFLAYQEKNNRELLGRYGGICARLMENWQRKNGILVGTSPPHPSPLPPEERESIGSSRIRVGIVSAQIFDDSVFNAITKGWFTQLDKSRFEINTFFLGTRHDDATALAQANSNRFESGIKGLREWATSIAASNVDVLIYPEIGMDPLTVQLACMRLAPLQLATWGHPETTGLPTIDYYLSAEDFETSGSDDCYTEQLIRLPNLGCYYETANVVAAKTNLRKLGIKAAGPIFVCPGAPFKYTPRHDHIFVEIARRLKTCQFVFFTFDRVPALSRKLFDRLAAAFKAANLDCTQYLVFVPWLEKRDFHGVMKQADVFLDTLGFSGFNTVMQAVECNLPIVTGEGRYLRGRFGSAIMKRLGIAELVAADDAAYIECAIRLALDDSYRKNIREKIRSSRGILFRDLAPIRALEVTLIDLMERGRARL